jgi:hypothetical protein
VVKLAASLAQNWPNAPPVAYDQLGTPAGFADDVLPTEAANVTGAFPIQDLQMQPGAQDRYRPYPQTYGVQGPVPGIGNGSEPPQNQGPTDADLRAVAAAAQSGRREIFDTAALGALVKHTRLASLLQRGNSRCLQVTSWLGDLLTHMHWNTDEWAEQFGQSEVGPLEDQIRSQFEGLGDLFLTLQEKAVTDGPDAGILPGLRPQDASENVDTN